MPDQATDLAPATQHVREWVHENTEPQPDGRQNGQSAVWAAETNLKAQARKDRVPFDVEDLDEALDELLDAGEIVTWHGLVAPATDEHLQAIIEIEANSDTTRGILVAKCNRLRAIEEGAD